MPPDAAQQLTFLSVCYYICAGLMVIPILCCGTWIAFAAVGFANQTPTGLANQPGSFQTGYAVGSSAFFCCLAAFPLFLIILSIATVIAGARLATHKSATFCNAVAFLLCFFFPIGTALGIYTLILLARPAVKAEFEANDRII